MKNILKINSGGTYTWEQHSFGFKEIHKLHYEGWKYNWNWTGEGYYFGNVVGAIFALENRYSKHIIEDSEGNNWNKGYFYGREV